MNDDVLAYLSEVAIKQNIKVIWSDALSAYTPPACYVPRRIVMMNQFWHNKQDIPFQLAHEMSHVINGDDTDMVFYNASYTGKQSVEYKANVGAVKLLIPFYCGNRNKEQANAYEFESIFNVPPYLNDAVIEQIKEYY